MEQMTFSLKTSFVKVFSSKFPFERAELLKVVFLKHFFA